MRTKVMAVVAATLALAACGGQGTGGSATPSADTYPASLKYLGATAGAADQSKTPVVLGWVNEQGGQISSPEATSGAEAAVALINDKLGGIGGAPLKLNTCFVASSQEEGQLCAQKMYNDKTVLGVLTGATSLSSPALHGLLGGKRPIMGSTPSDPSDINADMTYYTGNGVFGNPTSMATFAIKYLKAKKIAMVGGAFVGTTIAFGMIDTVAKNYPDVTITRATYPMTADDVTASIVASGARGADALIVLSPTTTGCIAVGKALKQLAITTHVVSLPTCIEDPVVQALGSVPAWSYSEPTHLPFASAPDPGGYVREYLAAMKAYQPGSTVQATAAPSFALVMYVARLLDQLGPASITAQSLAAKFASSTGPVFMGTPTLKFGDPPFKAIGTLGNSFYTYTKDGKWVSEAGGAYI